MIIKESVEIGDREITLETGRIARQANGAVLITLGETAALVTAVSSGKPREGISFFPLTCEYTERAYAGGKIPGGFFKREGRPREQEILVCRLMDRPIRPMFADGFRNETQVIATLLSADRQNRPDVLALTGASAALHISDIPFEGPLAGIRVGRIDGDFVPYPTREELERSDMDVVVAATREAIVMVEGGGDQISEADLVDALEYGHRSITPLLDLQEAMRENVGKERLVVQVPPRDETLAGRVEELFADEIDAATQIPVKHERYGKLSEIGERAVESLAEEFPEREGEVSSEIDSLKKKIVRRRILEQGRRIDGRSLDEVRPITCEVGTLPRVHGTGLFTRGETQAVVTTTLGVSSDEQRLDGLFTEEWKRFMLHYNFPPYSVGEARMMRGTSRREIGHGALAERALERVLPDHDDFPYTIRIVSEVTESNGSSSMATVCGGTLSLMDCGVPIAAPVAGIAMGLIQEKDQFAILSDILGDEDHLGDMDFKVTGTSRGITAVQMDIKIKGLPRDILVRALDQARRGRQHILDCMLETLPETRPELSKHAPRITTLKIRPDQIRIVIGPGGKMIRGIVDQTGVDLDVQDDGTVLIASPDSEAAQKAVSIIEGLVREPVPGEVFEGTVARIADFGAFVNILPNMDGLVHISELDWGHVDKVEDVCKEGDQMKVKVLEVDSASGKVRLSRKELLDRPEGAEARDRDRGGRRGDGGRDGRRGSRHDGGRDRKDGRNGGRRKDRRGPPRKR
ncbi:MAG: polyribonucleotide nucleotidyltransferase [Polyangia bacterium]